MSYSEIYNKLTIAFKNHQSFIIDNKELKFFSINFVSKNCNVNCYEYKIFEKGYLLNALLEYYLHNNSYSKSYIFPNKGENDGLFDCNNNFTYKMLHKITGERAEEIIIILHGLNERDWYKYLTWAEKLYKETAKSIVLFPISFHMDRAPKEWSASRLMFEVSKERKNLFPGLTNSSYANAALSTRINFEPERFFISGIQSYLDIIQFIEEIRMGKHKLISPNAKIDFLGYSAGAFLGELLMMGNYKNYFVNSKLFIFCGGSVVEEMYPSNRTILDSEASMVFKNFYTNNFEENIRKNDYVWEIYNKYEEIGLIFKSMLSVDKMKNLRNSLLRGIGDRIKVVVLEKDKVFSLKGIKETFESIPARNVKILDFDFNYTHEKPFPEKCNFDDKVNLAFNYLFDYVSSFLKRDN